MHGAFSAIAYKVTNSFKPGFEVSNVSLVARQWLMRSQPAKIHYIVKQQSLNILENWEKNMVLLTYTNKSVFS